MQQSPLPRDVALGFFADINAGKFDEAFARLAEDVEYEVVSHPPYGGRMDRSGLSSFMAATIQPSSPARCRLISSELRPPATGWQSRPEHAQRGKTERITTTVFISFVSSATA